MKVDCDKCGVKILPRTYRKNKGLCMPCKKGYRDRVLKPEDKNYAEKTKELVKLNEDELLDKIGLLDQCITSLENAFGVLTSPQKKWWSWLRLDTGVNWIEGVGIANCGAEITSYLEGKNLVEFQDRSARVWAGAILEVCAHYHHMVGPAMVANAKIAEEIGNVKRLESICRAIIQDFEAILERCEVSNIRPSEDDEEFISLSSLEFALDKSLEIGFGDTEVAAMKDRLINIWSKPLQTQP